jgi:hypothetical protein
VGAKNVPALDSYERDWFSDAFTERDLWAEFAAIHSITKPHRTMRPIPENTAVSILISIILYGQKQVRDGLADDPPCEGTKHDGDIIAGITQHP